MLSYLLFYFIYFLFTYDRPFPAWSMFRRLDGRVERLNLGMSALREAVTFVNRPLPSFKVIPDLKNESKEGLGEVKLYFLFYTHYFWLDTDFSIFKKLLFIIFGQAAHENVHCLVIVCTIYKGVLPPSEWSIPPFPLKTISPTKFIKKFQYFYACYSNSSATMSIKKNKCASHALLDNSRHAYSQPYSFRELQGIILTLSTLSVSSLIPLSVFTLPFFLSSRLWDGRPVLCF